MRIDLNQGPQSLIEATRSNTQRAESNNSAREPLGVEDQAQLSGTHVQVQALAAQAAQLPEIREERVQALRHAIQSGQYQASPEKTAGAMFAHMIAQPAA